MTLALRTRSSRARVVHNLETRVRDKNVSSTRQPSVAHGTCSTAVLNKESVLRSKERVWRRQEIKATVPCNTLNVWLRLHPGNRFPKKLVHVLVRWFRAGIQTVLSDPNRQLVLLVVALDPLLESRKIVLTTVPVQCKERNLATNLVAPVHEPSKPFSVVHHLRRTDINTPQRVWLELLHEKTDSRFGVQVGLTLNVRLVECENVLDVEATDFILALHPLQHLGRTPECRNILEILKLLDIAVLPVVVP